MEADNKLNNTHLKKQLYAAWEFRLNQKNDLALELFYKITEYLEGKEDYANAEFKISLLALESSLSRWKKQFSKAKHCLDKISKQFLKTDLQKNYFYFLELGLYYFSLSEYMDSLDYFTKAKILSKNNQYKFIALFNIYTVSNKLELSSKYTLKQLQACFQEIKHLKTIDGLIQQYHYLEIYQLWKMADLSAINKIKKKLSNTQALYFQLYLNNTPYLDLDLNLSHDDLFSIKDLYLSNYRIRTLSGRLHPDDFNIQNADEITDRLYLWFWKFLSNPEKFPINKITEYLFHIQFFSKKSLSQSSRYKLKNIYLALALLSKTDLNSTINTFYYYSEQKNYLLDLEKNIFLYLSSNSIHKEDILKEIQSSPVFNHKRLGFKELLNGQTKKTDPLYKLSQAVHTKRPQVSSIYSYLINGQNNKFNYLKKEKTIISKIFVDALTVLFKEKEISCQSFFFKVCGIPEYDSFIHAKRLWNILSKLKIACPEDFSYKIRNNIIYVTANWEKFFLIKKGIYLEQVQNSNFLSSLNRVVHLEEAQIKNLTTQKEKSLQDTQDYTKNTLSPKDIENFISRKDLEIILNTSRSSVGRTIQRWSKENLITKKGEGKNTQYKLDKKIIAELAKG